MKKELFLFILFCLIVQSNTAQNTKAYTTREVFNPIIIDGILDEESWDNVKWGENFIQTEPKNGEKPTFETRFKILYDQDNLYVGIRAFDGRPDSIVVSNKPRDFFDGDYVEINIDSDFDRRDAFSFTITAAGIRGDEHIKTSENWFNDWNPDWTAKTQIDEKGWLAELKIPFTELEIYSKKKHWGIQVNRSLERYDEGSSWTAIADEDKWVEYFGLLKGLENVPVSTPLTAMDKIKPNELQNDFIDLYNTLASSYPSLYRYHSKAFISNIYNQVLMDLRREMTLVDFYKTVSTFVSKIGDGHMSVQFPDSFSTHYYDNLKHLPFKIKATRDGTYISENYSQNDLLHDAQVIAINGKLIQEITDEIAQLIPSDGYNVTGKYYRMSNDFDFYYGLFDKLSETVQIDFIPQGKRKVHSITLPLLTNTMLNKIKQRHDQSVNHTSFDFSIEEDVSIMSIRTFNHAEGFKSFVDASFKKIADANIDKLILDFRGNGGGEESNAIHLYSYLTKEPFRYYDSYEVSVEPNATVKQESTLISYETLNFFASISEKNSINTTIITDFEPLEGRFLDPTEFQQPANENNFDGDVVVLIDGGSFSATSEICAIMKRDQRATLVGIETGGGFDGNTSGIYDQITLSNSRLKVKIPLVKYVSDTENAEFLFGRGVLPHYQFNAYNMGTRPHGNDPTINFGIEYLNSKN